MPQYLVAGCLPDDFDPSQADEATGREIHSLNKEMSAAGVRNTSQPDVAPVGFEFDGEHFYIGGLDQKRSLVLRKNSDRATSRLELVPGLFHKQLVERQI